MQPLFDVNLTPHLILIYHKNMKKRTNYILYLVFLLIVYSILFIPFKNYIVDDTFIHIQFAKNVVNLGEFSFNAGEPTYGMTSPLWVLLIAFFHKLTSVDPVLITRSLSFSFGFLTILTLFALVLKVSKAIWLLFFLPFS